MSRLFLDIAGVVWSGGRICAGNGRGRGCGAKQSQFQSSYCIVSDDTIVRLSSIRPVSGQ